MDEATSKQKEFIRSLLLDLRFHWRNINPPKFWDINKEEASQLVSDLKVLRRHYSRDLRDMICQNMDGKHIIYNMVRTIEEMEEEQADYDPTVTDWLDQQTYEDDIRQNEWIHEMRAEIRKKEVLA